MVDREKSNQACSQGLSERLKEDRISELPDPLICHILSHLPTKEAVSTSVLSTRWKTLWLWVPKLKLDFREIRDFNAFVSFGDRFFDSSRVSWIDKLKLTIGKHDDDDGFKDTSYITSWIEAAVKRKVQHLRVDFYLRLYYEMPISLHVFEKLVSLKLFCVKLNDVEFVSFPCLKTMDLACVCLSKLSNDAFERLVSCCPVLEDLEIVHCWNVPQHLRVQSRSLKMLNISHTFGCSQIENGQGVVIDAPLLCCLSIIDDRSKSFIVNNMEYNAKLEVDVTFGLKVTDEASISSGRSLIRSFLSGISKVGDLTIHPQTFKIIYNYSKSESLPQFGFMSRLCVSLYPSSIKGLLATFLESCPNLKSLVLELHYGYCLDGEEMPWEEMPECFQSLSLEFVDFKFPFRVYVDEMKLVRCFLENCVILKKLTVHLYSNPTKYEALKKLLELEIPTKCEFVIVEE